MTINEIVLKLNGRVVRVIKLDRATNIYTGDSITIPKVEVSHD